MKKILLGIFIVFFSLSAYPQLLSWTPDFPVESTSPLTITLDASKGNKGLLNYDPADVYVHIGVITSLSTSGKDWKYVKTTWGTTDPLYKAVSLGNNKWSFTITGGLRQYFGLATPSSESIKKIAIIFRNGAGTKQQGNVDNSDMYVPIYMGTLAVRITNPFFQPTYQPIPETITKTVGDNIELTAISNNSSTLKLYLNGVEIATASAAKTISANPILNTGGNQQVIAEANNGGTISKDTLNFFVSGGVTVAPLPAGTKEGINYNANNTSATLVLYAPGKGRICVIGEFDGSNWTEQSQFQMNKTPDGNYWWITINGLTAGKEYAYQYLINGTLKIADPYAEKILDPANDQFISASTYPDLKAYSTGATGIVSVLQTAKPAYNWQVNDFTKPDKRNLVIYELLLRDFVANHNWNTLRDTINYLKKLGINAIEIMPFNEFEGNLSWGYNPDFYFAPDKYYGPANTLKEFIDTCHKNGIAVIMDIALNHSFGSSPMVQMYWDAANNRPSADNPWFNPVAKHAFNVGYDMNHESLATRYFTSRVLDHWLNNYKVDGFRFDLSKGFTQTKTCDDNGGNCNVSAWSAYDQSRIDIWKRYYDTMQLKSAGSYAILEHFADNSEEKVLSDYGMLLWGNENYNYNQASMGYSAGWDFSGGIAAQRGWTNPFLVTYMESHDEERLMFKNLAYGNSAAGYNIKDTTTALKRQELDAAFFLTIPGPKMIWQFGEIGYDYPINYCTNGTVSDNCRLDSKPIKWNYLQQPNRKKLYDVYSSLIKLRFNPLFQDQFVSNSTQQNLSGSFKWIKMDKIVVIGNFDVTTQTGSVTFPFSGPWYDYLNGGIITTSGNPQAFTLAPGEYHIYTRTFAALPVTIVNFSGRKEGNKNILTWEVASEINLNSYELQKSIDGQNFSFVASIKAAGNTIYQFSDESLSATEFYRLKSIDNDGRYNYSSVVKIERTISAWKVKVNPNPVFETLKLAIESPIRDKAILILTDLSGRQLIKENIGINSGKNSFEIPESSKFSKGTYLLSIYSSRGAETIKIIKGK